MKTKLLVAAAALALAACGQTSVFDIGVGDCFDDPSEVDQVSSVQVVDCAEPHDNEVYAVFDYTGGIEFPGEDEMEFAANDGCIGRFESFVGIDYFESEIFVSAFWPSPDSWEDGDREIVCFVYEGDFSKITGTLRNAAR
ncbi:MAG: hypothetical protein GTN62_11790 [Gemmatimonadales bacterium]|nr:hypothetical protein [Gemmatimonadales bacterium]NIP08241.1 hypothetical protein [Gemmatimonadales bacterium]